MERWNLRHLKNRVSVRLTPLSPSGPVPRLARDVVTASATAAAHVLARLPAPGPGGALTPQEGMLTALALLGVRLKEEARKLFLDNLLELPEEVYLYWFIGCFHGHRQGAFRNALRTLLAATDDQGE